MAGKGNTSDITSLPGVGAATAKKLNDAKLNTVAKIAKASAKDLQKAGLTVAVAKKVHAAAKAASATKTDAKNTAKKASLAAKKAASKTGAAAKKAGGKAKASAKKAATASKKATNKAVSKGQEVAEDVVEKTKAAKTTLRTKKEKDRKGSTISVPRSVQDMPWFKKK